MREKFTVFSHHPDYEKMLPVWDYLKDLYDGLDSWLQITPSGYIPTAKAQAYIPKHAAESFENWVHRINATYYDDPFAQALQRFNDLLFRTTPVVEGDAQEFAKDADLLTPDGQSFSAFALGVSLSVMLYGRSFILVDFPSNPMENYRDYIEKGFRPYWVEIKPQQLINWSTSVVAGREAFDWAVIEEFVYESDGFGHELVRQVRLLRPGSWEIWRIAKTKDAGGNPTDFEYKVDGGETGLDYIPLVPCYGRQANLSNALPFFKSLADKNRTLYQITSDHLRKVSLCCNPTPVLKDQMRSPDDDLEIGPNSFVYLRDPNGTFTWQEPLAMSIEQSRRTLEDLQKSINHDAARFLEQPSDRQSASATNLMTSPLEANLQTFVTFFGQGLEKAIQCHESYFGNSVDPTVIFNVDIFPNTGKDSQAAFALATFHKDGLISKRTTLKGLYELGILPQDFNIDTEVDDGSRRE